MAPEVEYSTMTTQLPTEFHPDQLEELYGNPEPRVAEEVEETETRTELPTPMGTYVTVNIQRHRTVYR